jgi:hypothetical protein
LKYEIYVDDNFNMDEDERTKAGEFETLEEAIAEAERIVDNYLLVVYKKHPEFSAEELFKEYTRYGVDPWIFPNYSKYNSWEYAKKRSREICILKESLLADTSDNSQEYTITEVLGPDNNGKMIS